MALSRYEHTGAAPQTGLASGIGSTDTTFTVNSGTGYPTGAVGKFVICIDAGTASEEKILCSARSGTSFTVAASGRGYDGTTAASHSSGSTNVTHVLSAAEIDDASDHIYTTTRDDHTQYARTDGTRAFTGGVTVNTGGAQVTGNSKVTGTLEVTAAATLDSTLAVTGAVTASSTLTGTALIPSGLTGATAASRFVGCTSSGAPVSGTFAVGDYIVDQKGGIWVCTTAGSPGTWTPVGLTANPAGRMYQSTQQTPFAGAAWTQVTNMAQDFGVGGVTFASNALTVPIAGKYQLNAAVSWTGDPSGGGGSTFAVGIYKNGSRIRAGRQPNNTLNANITTAVSDLATLAANDVLTLYAYQNTPDNLAPTNDPELITALSVALMSR